MSSFIKKITGLSKDPKYIKIFLSNVVETIYETEGPISLKNFCLYDKDNVEVGSEEQKSKIESLLMDSMCLLAVYILASYDSKGKSVAEHLEQNQKRLFGIE